MCARPAKDDADSVDPSLPCSLSRDHSAKRDEVGPVGFLFLHDALLMQRDEVQQAISFSLN